MDRKPRKQLPGVTARRRKGGAGGAPECGGFSRVPRIHTVRVRFMYFYCHPLHPWGIKMKRIKRMKLKKGATFLPERYYLSRSLQPPFSENKHQYVILSSGYLLSHRLHRFSFVLRTPFHDYKRQLLQHSQHLMATVSPKSAQLTKEILALPSTLVELS